MRTNYLLSFYSSSALFFVLLCVGARNYLHNFAVATDLFLGTTSRLLATVAKITKTALGLSLLEKSNGGTISGSVGVGEDGNAVDYEERIGKVMEDEIEPVVLWERRVKDIGAEKERHVITSPGFSFSASGFLLPYHLGVARFLIENSYIKDTTPLAGSSVGAVVCAVIASGVSMQVALNATKILANNCRLKGTAFCLGAVLRNVLEELLPDGIHISCYDSNHVERPTGLLLDQFDSKEDLINAVVTSSFVPGFLAPRPATLFRNRLCIDGGLTSFLPPTSAAQTVRVCAFPASRFGMQGIGISPDCNPENRAGPRELFNWVFEPAEDEILDRFFELGYLDAAVWAAENPVEKVVHDDIQSEKIQNVPAK